MIRHHQRELEGSRICCALRYRFNAGRRAAGLSLAASGPRQTVSLSPDVTIKSAPCQLARDEYKLAALIQGEAPLPGERG